MTPIALGYLVGEKKIDKFINAFGEPISAADGRRRLWAAALFFPDLLMGF